MRGAPYPMPCTERPRPWPAAACGGCACGERPGSEAANAAHQFSIASSCAAKWRRWRKCRTLEGIRRRRLGHQRGIDPGVRLAAAGAGRYAGRRFPPAFAAPAVRVTPGQRYDRGLADDVRVIRARGVDDDLAGERQTQIGSAGQTKADGRQRSAAPATRLYEVVQNDLLRTRIHGINHAPTSGTLGTRAAAVASAVAVDGGLYFPAGRNE
jgi:hypothetical protein